MYGWRSCGWPAKYWSLEPGLEPYSLGLYGRGDEALLLAWLAGRRGKVRRTGRCGSWAAIAVVSAVVGITVAQASSVAGPVAGPVAAPRARGAFAPLGIALVSVVARGLGAVV